MLSINKTKLFLHASFISMIGAIAFNVHEWGLLFLYYTIVFLLCAVTCAIFSRDKFDSKNEYIQLEGMNLSDKKR